MCGIFICLAIVPWILDLVQRILSFGLAMCIGFAVCLSMIIAISAGVAYGYNYSMSEFLTLSKKDMNVHIRRGGALPKFSIKQVARSGPLRRRKLKKMPLWLESNQSDDNSPISDRLRETRHSNNYVQKLDGFSGTRPREYESLSIVSDVLYVTEDAARNEDRIRQSESDIVNHDEINIEDVVREVVNQYNERKHSSETLEPFIRFIQTTKLGNLLSVTRTTTYLTVDDPVRNIDKKFYEKETYSEEPFKKFRPTNKLEENMKIQAKKPEEVYIVSTKVHTTDPDID